MRLTWSILTPEYPPDAGGIGDYVALVAARLAELGDEVTVFTRAASERESAPGVRIELLPDDFGARSERTLARAWAALPERGVALVQYAPQSFGRRGVNVPFMRWLGARRERVWLMVHEPLFPFAWDQPPERWALAGLTRLMLRLATRSAERLFVSIPAWERFVGVWGSGHARPEWLPIPSTLGPEPEALVELAAALSGGTPQTVAHFGTYGEFLAAPLEAVLTPLIVRRPDVGLVLLGGGSDRFRDTLVAKHPGAAGRIRASGRASPELVASELSRAGATVFPFLEGATTRRTSLMSALSVGAAIVTVDGAYSEAFWRTSGAVSLFRYNEPEAGARALERLLAEPETRARQRERALALYRERFALEHVVERLRRLHRAGATARRA